MEINPHQANSCTITDVSFLFWNRDRRDTSFFPPPNTHTTSNTTMTIQQPTSSNNTIDTTRHDTRNNTGTPQAQAHLHLQHRCRPTSFQAARGLDRNTKTNSFCVMPRFTESQGIAHRERAAFWYLQRVRHSKLSQILVVQ